MSKAFRSWMTKVVLVSVLCAVAYSCAENNTAEDSHRGHLYSKKVITFYPPGDNKQVWKGNYHVFVYRSGVACLTQLGNKREIWISGTFTIEGLE